MAISLYDLSVPTFLQTVKAVGGFLLRTRGVPLGKRDYEGRLRTRTA
jgi:hypothetical protein